MRTNITSNLRPLLRAFYAFFIAIAALWAMPRNARAQILYVTQQGAGIVSEYDATTGGAINANFITGLHRPNFLAVKGNTLFVASLVHGSFVNGTVGAYDATTGDVIKAHFIKVSDPWGLAVNENTLFVASLRIDTVGAYDATTGAAINANFITGLDHPTGLAVHRFVLEEKAGSLRGERR